LSARPAGARLSDHEWKAPSIMTTESSVAKVVAGVDTHADTHHVAVLDAATGGVLADKKFPTGRAGYTALIAFVCAFGQVLRFGVEGTNSYGAGLSRHLRVAGHTVVEVVRPNRAERRLRGKSDPLDAITAARTAMAPERLPMPKTSDGVVEAIRVLLTTRRSAVKARTGAMQQICSILVSAPDTLRQQYEPLPAKSRLERLRRLHPGTDPTDVHAVTSRCLKQLATRCADLDREVDAIDASMRHAITDHAPALLAAHGVGVVTAATLLVTAGDNPERVTSEAGLAALCGVSPIPASSGKTTRHRLNRGGDRQANCAIHQIALVRMSSDERTRAYIAKKRAEGKSTKEAMRCLKRAICREVYRLLINPPEVPRIDDLRPLRQARGITLTTAAKHFAVWPAVISTLERGLRRDDNLATAYRQWLTAA